MGGGAGAVYEAGEALVARVVAFGSAPELPRLRSLHRYRVAPPAPPITAPMCQPPLHSAVNIIHRVAKYVFDALRTQDATQTNLVVFMQHY